MIVAVIPTYLASQASSIASMIEVLRSAASEIFVLANSQVAAQELQQRGIQHVNSRENLTFGPSFNKVAFELCPEADWYILLNDDLILDPSASLRLSGLLTAGDFDVMGLLPRGVTVERLPGVIGTFMRVSMLNRLRVKRDRALPASIQATELPPKCGFPFNAVAISGASASTLGGFDKGYILYFEDADFLLRAASHGLRVGVAAIDATHEHSVSAKNASTATLRVMAQSAVRYLNSNAPSPLRRWSTLIVRLALLTRALLISVQITLSFLTCHPASRRRDLLGTVQTLRNLGRVVAAAPEW